MGVLLVGLARLFVWPASGPPRRADAVVVLGGGDGRRLGRGLELVRSGTSRQLVVSGAAVPQTEEQGLDCGQRWSIRLWCVRPVPATTAGEARAVARLADRRGWTDLAVVTSAYHITRARVLLCQCHGGRVTMVEVGRTHPRLRFALEVAQEIVAMPWALTGGRAC